MITDRDSGKGRFAISLDDAYAALSAAVLLPPSGAYVEVAREEVTVRMSWAFRCHYPRSTVASTWELHKHPLSRGVHGFGGRWLVNGSGGGILVITLKATQRAYVLGARLSYNPHHELPRL